MHKRRLLPLLLALVLVFEGVGTIFAAAGGGQILREQVIAPGTVHRTYKRKIAKGNVIFDAVTVDLNNPGAKVDLITGAGKTTQKATVSQMAARTGAVAAVNGDFFNTKAQGSPLGASIQDGRLITAPMNSVGYQTLAITKDNTASIGPVTFGGRVTIGGHTYPIQGLNKAEYWDNITGAHSHTDTIHVYDDHWNATSRGKVSKNAVEVVVADGVVENATTKGAFPFSVPAGKLILQGNGKGAEFLRNYATKGAKISVETHLFPKKDYRMLIGGHGILVEKGKAVPYALAPESIGGYRPRTAVGISQNGKNLTIVAVEKSSRSVGMRLSDLASLMADLGCYKAMNLDGGGSTAMAVEDLGETKAALSIKPEGGSERKVVNGLGVMNVAPEGPMTHLAIKGPDAMVLGEIAAFEVRGWDDNYHAKDLSGKTPLFRDDQEGTENWNGKEKLARATGAYTIRTEVDGIPATKMVRVDGPETLKALVMKANVERPKVGDKITLTFSGTTKDGRSVKLHPSIFQLTGEGLSGHYDASSGVYTVKSVADGVFASLTANVRGKTASVSFTNPDYRHIHMNIGKKTYTVDGAKRTMDTTPLIKNDRTMVPLRFLVEAFGGEVIWDDATRTAQVQYRGHTIRIPVGAKELSIDGETVPIDSPAIIAKERTLVPIRFISEGFGMVVRYDETQKGVDIFDKRVAEVGPAIDPAAPKPEEPTPEAPKEGNTEAPAPEAPGTPTPAPEKPTQPTPSPAPDSGDAVPLF